MLEAGGDASRQTGHYRPARSARRACASTPSVIMISRKKVAARA